MIARACVHVAAFVRFYVDTPVTVLYTDDEGSRDLLACPVCDVVVTVDQFHDLLTATLVTPA